jgi:hypothetical protein
MVFFVRTAPARLPPVPSLLVRPPGVVGPVRPTGGVVRDAKGLLVGSDGSLLAGFPPVEIALAEAAAIAILAPSRPFVVSGRDGVASTFREEGVTHAVLGFMPEDSDWPRRATFPAFVARLLETAGGSQARGMGFSRAGDAPRRPPAGEAGLRTEEGGKKTATSWPSSVFGPPSSFLPGAPVFRETATGRALAPGLPCMRSGLYVAGASAVAVNLVSEAESDNRPAPAPPDVVAVAAAPARGPKGVAATSFDAALALAALAFLAAEWLVSARRT